MIELIIFNAAHLNKTFKWMQSKNLRKMFFMRKEITWEQHLQWFDRYKVDHTQRIFAVYYAGEHVGNLGLKNITEDKIAETWIYIGTENIRGKGVASKAYEAMLVHPDFLRLELRKLYCHIADFNNNSAALYAKLGFTIEGVFKDQIQIEEAYYSLLKMGKIL